jgi:eukaryotic-like serine/threonine-protein kinase
MRGPTWRRHRLRVRLTAIAAGGTTAGFIAVILSPAAWAGAVGGLATALVTAIAFGVQAEWRRHSEVVRRLPAVLQVSDTGGRFPQVRDVADPIAVGVHPAAPIEARGVIDRVPPYVPRDKEPELHAELRRGGFVLIVGESAAGKSRAAFEAVRLLCGRHSFAAPSSRESLPGMVEVLTEVGDFVVWLDDLERYLGTGGLTLPLLHRLTTHDAHTIVLATMRSHEYDCYRDRAESESSPANREAWRECRAVLRQARIIHLDRRWTPQEKVRTRQLAADDRLARALAASDRFGIAETLAAGPELAEAWRDAWTPGRYPRGAALVAAAVAARRAGYHKPLSLDVLDRMHGAFLEERGGPELQPESLAEAQGWATAPTFPNGANSLLIGSGERGFQAFDYLIDLPQAQEIPSPSWIVLIESVARSDAFDLGEQAMLADRHDRALTAYRSAARSGYAPAEATLAMLGVPFSAAPESLARAWQHLNRTRDELGDDHETTLLAEQTVVILSMNNGHYREALALTESVAQRGGKRLGPDHRIVLAAQWAAAIAIFRLGPVVEGLTLLDTAVARATDILGIQDTATASRRIIMVELLAEAGHPDLARERLASVRADYSGRPPGNYISMLLADVTQRMDSGLTSTS